MGSISSIASVAASSSAGVYAPTVDVGFTATVAGKDYNAGVIYSGGEYLAKDASVSGAEATGTNVETAESNLISRIDAIV